MAGGPRITLPPSKRRASNISKALPDVPQYAAVLDACVLVPIALADTLLRVAEKGLYRPLWSDRILGEAQTAIEQIHPGIDVGKRFTNMREAFGDALVTGWEELEAGISLPDLDDRHVVATAPPARAASSTPSEAAPPRRWNFARSANPTVNGPA